MSEFPDFDDEQLYPEIVADKKVREMVNVVNQLQGWVDNLNLIGMLPKLAEDIQRTIDIVNDLYYESDRLKSKALNDRIREQDKASRDMLNMYLEIAPALEKAVKETNKNKP